MMTQTIPRSRPNAPELAHSEAHMLPQPDVQYLRQIKELGFERLGVGTGIIGSDGKILIAEHRKRDKTQEGQLGPLTETMQCVRQGDSLMVESPHLTIARVLHEEAGIQDPKRLELQAKFNGWFQTVWPVLVNGQEQLLVGIGVIAHIDSEKLSGFLPFQPNEEIKDLHFMTPDEIFAAHEEDPTRLRPGTIEWLETAQALGLLAAPADEMVTLELPSPTPLANGQDVIFSRMGHYL